MKRLLLLAVLFSVLTPQVHAQESDSLFKKLELRALEFILPPSALKLYKSMSDSEKVRWAERYWRAVDPTPTTPQNEYYQEFLQRLRYAFRHFRNMVPPYFMDDRARYYIRFGPPDDLVESVGLGKKYRSNQTWAYYSYNLFVDFVEFDTYGYREVADLSEAVKGYPGNERARIASELYQERADLSPKYLAFRNVRNDLQYFSEIQDLTEERKRAELQAPPVKFSFSYQAEPLNVLLSSCVFRGNGGRSRVELYYLVPLRELTFEPQNSGKLQAELQSTLVLYNERYEPVIRRVFHIPLSVASKEEAQRRSFANQQNEELLPGTYFLAWRFEDRLGNRLAILKSQLNVRGFPADSLSVSDVQFAHRILLNATGSNLKANGIKVVPYISTTVLKSRPIMIYFEIYNLHKNEGKTHFKVAYEITALGQAGSGLRDTATRIVNFLRGKKPQENIGMSFESRGESDFEQIYSSLDFSKTTPGKKQLTVTVTDLVSGEKATTTRTFILR